ncbi:MAG: ATP-binding protein [Balneolaceae bacterium]
MAFQAATKNLQTVRDFVAKYAFEHGYTEKAVHEITLAVDEAATNIIKHAYKFDSSRKVDLSLTFEPEKICIILSDQGRNFTLQAFNKPDIEKQVKSKKRGGMGVYMIHSLMDQVRYASDGDTNEIIMCKKRSHS